MTRHHRARILLAVLTVLAFSGCVHRPPVTRPGSFATAQPTQLIVDQLLFGRNIPTGGTVSDSAWYLFLDEVVTPRFPDGFGTLRSEGQWRYADGRVEREAGFVLELTYFPGTVADSAVEAIAREYMRRFNQEAVSRHTWPVQHLMYSSGKLR